MIEAIAFYAVSALVLTSAVLMVSRRNVFHSALWLILCLTGVAGIYAMLAADFLFAVQLLAYVGGIMVLLLFVVLLSGRPEEWLGRQVNEKAWGAALFSAVLVGGLYSVISAWTVSPVTSTPRTTTASLGHLLFNEMLLPTEAVSLVLVAALIGAIYFSVKKTPR